MQLEHAWERSLLDRAYEALRGQSEHPTTLEGFDHGVLETAYDYCDNMTAVNSRSFYLASGLLPVPKRRAVRALYAFCRVSDDIVDPPMILWPSPGPTRGNAIGYRHAMPNS
jgi:phytoene synthase